MCVTLPRCRNGRCIPKSWKCDGEFDCPDKEDEGEACNGTDTCDESQFKCGNNKWVLFIKKKNFLFSFQVLKVDCVCLILYMHGDIHVLRYLINEYKGFDVVHIMD